jgi:hypothetical protein
VSLWASAPTLTARQLSGWKNILNALTVHYGERITNHR